MSQVVKSKTNAVVPKPERFRVPNIDILEKENEYVIEADLPGVKKNDLHVQFHKGELTISGKAEKKEEKKEKNYRFKQFEAMDFHRTFRIGNAVNVEKVTAQFEGGVLTVHMPKSDSVKPKKIEVTKN